MSKFSEEFRVIPRTAKVVAGCLYFGLAGVIYFVLRNMVRGDEDGVGPPVFFMAFMMGVVPLIWAALTLLIGYVNGDARRRGMRYVMWTLLAIFIPNAIGIILYFIMREPLMKTCPACGTGVKGGFAFCPKCGSAMAPACPQCKAAVEAEWTHCARCGAGLRTAVMN